MTHPKVELHLHLDSSLSYRIARKLDNSLNPKSFRDKFVAPPKCKDLNDYLVRVARQVNLLQSAEALAMASEDLVRQLAEDGVIYAEVRYAPLLHIRDGLQPEEVVETVSHTLSEASRDTDLEVRVILCTLRHFSEKQSMQTAELAHEYRDANIVALDIAGDESGFPLDAHRQAFEYAKDHGLMTTAHAGEAEGPDSVIDTLESLHPHRVGHGVRSHEDQKLVTHLKNQDIHLEICPTSNIQTDIYHSIRDHTISELFETGVSLSINTDGRTTSNVTLTEEYQKLTDAFGWGTQEFRICNLNAAEAAFLPGPEKDKLKEKIIEGYS
ncbi:MAG: adenosine deaminase [Balneolaceae bacterium]|nr:adenosine deaminase [Balneolaceae bacterium]